MTRTSLWGIVPRERNSSPKTTCYIIPFVFQLKISFIFMCVGALPVYMSIHMEDRWGHQVSWDWNYRCLWGTMWVLAVEPGSSERAVILTTEPSLQPYNLISMKVCKRRCHSERKQASGHHDLPAESDELQKGTFKVRRQCVHLTCICQELPICRLLLQLIQLWILLHANDRNWQFSWMPAMSAREVKWESLICSCNDK